MYYSLLMDAVIIPSVGEAEDASLCLIYEAPQESVNKCALIETYLDQSEQAEPTQTRFAVEQALANLVDKGLAEVEGVSLHTFYSLTTAGQALAPELACVA